MTSLGRKSSSPDRRKHRKWGKMFGDRGGVKRELDSEGNHLVLIIENIENGVKCLVTVVGLKERWIQKEKMKMVPEKRESKLLLPQVEGLENSALRLVSSIHIQFDQIHFQSHSSNQGTGNPSLSPSLLNQLGELLIQLGEHLNLPNALLNQLGEHLNLPNALLNQLGELQNQYDTHQNQLG